MDRIQQKALEIAVKGHNVLLTGFPGTGKSFTICQIAKELKDMAKNVQVTASTDIAAQNMQSKLKHFGTSTVHNSSL